MEDVATAVPHRRLQHKLATDLRFRMVVLTITGAITTALAVAASSNWPVAILIAALVVTTTALALFVADRFSELEQRSAQQDDKLKRCESGHQTCQDDLHARDVLIAMFHVSLTPKSKGRGRRQVDALASPLEQALRSTLGSRADATIARARSLLATK